MSGIKGDSDKCVVGRSIFYRPEDGVCGDFIPFYEDGWYYLFYLKDFRDREKHGEGCPWFGLRSRDLRNWEELGEMIPRGGREEQDLFVYTGSVFHDTMGSGKYHIFYTGHNPYIVEEGRPQEVIMHAVGETLTRWEKIGEERFAAVQDYEENDWRDPFVFWDEEEGRYGLILTARKKTGEVRGRGVTVLCHSDDLRSWKRTLNLWDPAKYVTHECPDLFQMGEWWYLIFSEFSDRFRTHYVMAHSSRGPWKVPEKDVFDTRAYYAAKSVWDGSKRYLFGWLATREGDCDAGAWQWGGSLVVHELYQMSDGLLAVRMPEHIREAFQAYRMESAHAESSMNVEDSVIWERESMRLDGCSRLDKRIIGGLSAICMLSFSVKFDGAAGEFVLVLPGDEGLPEGYHLLFLPGEGKTAVRTGGRTYPDPEFCGIERSVQIEPGRGHQVEILLEGDCMVMYVDSMFAMSTRLYRRGSGNVSVQCYGMRAEISGFRVT